MIEHKSSGLWQVLGVEALAYSSGRGGAIGLTYAKIRYVYYIPTYTRVLFVLPMKFHSDFYKICCHRTFYFIFDIIIVAGSMNNH